MKYFKFKYVLSFIRIIIIKIINLNKIKFLGIKYYFGKNIEIELKKGSSLVLQDKIYFSNYCHVFVEGGNVKIGFNNFFNSFCRIVSMYKIEIGNNCLFGPNVSIYDHNHKHKISEQLICKQGYDIGKVLIGSNVWIGANTVITAGVNIGNNIVIGANSVVTDDLESNGIYAGSPAKLIK